MIAWMFIVTSIAPTPAPKASSAATSRGRLAAEASRQRQAKQQRRSDDDDAAPRRAARCAGQWHREDRACAKPQQQQPEAALADPGACFGEGHQRRSGGVAEAGDEEHKARGGLFAGPVGGAGAGGRMPCGSYAGGCVALASGEDGPRRAIILPLPRESRSALALGVRDRARTQWIRRAAAPHPPLRGDLSRRERRVGPRGPPFGATTLHGVANWSISRLGAARRRRTRC